VAGQSAQSFCRPPAGAVRSPSALPIKEDLKTRSGATIPSTFLNSRGEGRAPNVKGISVYLRAWIDTLKDAGVQLSMDGKGRWIDNVFIERLWRSVKYENVYLRAYENGTQLRRG